MSGEERKAVAFVAILLGLSAVARAVNRPNPIQVTGATAIQIDQRLAENQQVRQRKDRPATSAAAPRKPAAAPVWRTPGNGVVIDNRLPKGGLAAPLNLNRATAGELDALPGISPAVAQRIVEYRTGRGGFFTDVEQLDSVKGIGPKVLEKIRPLVKLR